MLQCFLSLLPMQLGILQISFNSSAIRSHISEVGTVLYILVAVPSKWLFRIHVQWPVLYSFQLEKSIPKTHWQDTWNRLYFSDSQKCKDKWHSLRSTYMRERRKSKEKKYQEVGLRWEGNSHFMVSWIFWSSTRSVELWKYSRYSTCNWSFIHGSRWNWNGQFWTTGRRKYNSWSENGRRVE